MLGFILNHANINYDSRVLIVDNTKGLLLGALVEKKIRSGLKVEFNVKMIKN